MGGIGKHEMKNAADRNGAGNGPGRARRVLAIDFGASSGRAMLADFDGSAIHMEEIHRFSNDPVIVGDTMYWDVLRLFYEIKQSLIKAKSRGAIDSMAVNTWGVDFGLLDEKGRLLENPVHYRDGRTAGMMEEAFSRISKEELYEITGNQLMEINTVFQLLALKQQNPGLLERASTLLMMPDLLHYFLCGQLTAERSIASTSQLYDTRKKAWSGRVMEALGLPAEIFPDIVPSGTVIGQLTDAICEELGIPPVKVVAVAGHDTQDAQVAVPAREQDFAFLSCGTWSLFGTETEAPVIDETSLKYNITNEAAAGDRNSFLKNIIGLWLIQESRRQWIREGKTLSFGELEAMAAESKPFQSFIDPDAPEFVPAGNIPERIRQYCRRTGQPVPQTEADIVRCINESLAMKYRGALQEMQACTGKTYEILYMIGGGIQSCLLCQMTANACGCRVSAGPVEATVYGNVALQLKALGTVESLAEIREIIRNSEPITYYEPQDTELWEEAYERYLVVTDSGRL